MSQEKDLLELSTSHHFIQMSEVYSTHFQFLFLYSYTSPEKLCMILHTSKQYFFISAPGYISMCETSHLSSFTCPHTVFLLIGSPS